MTPGKNAFSSTKTMRTSWQSPFLKACLYLLLYAGSGFALSDNSLAASLSINISLTDAPARSTGTGLAVLWNSRFMRLQGIDELYPNDLLIDTPPIEADLKDLDGDPSTDRLIRLTWISIDGSWQPGNRVLARLSFDTFHASAAANGYRIVKLSGQGSPSIRLLTGPDSAFAAQVSTSPVTAKQKTAYIISRKKNQATARSVTSAPTAQAQAARGAITCGIDIDENGTVDALTDGLLAIRHLFGFSGPPLTQGAIAADALMNTAQDITAMLQTPECQAALDIDGNGQTDALTDGVLFIRWAFGFTGPTLIQGVVASDAPRNTAEAIEAYLASLPLLSSAEASRLLTQATFGPQLDQIEYLSRLPGGIRAWLEQQFNLPFVPSLPAVKDLTARMCKTPTIADTNFSAARHQLWWENAIEGDDQLRQRVAFALSQILVVSDHSPAVKKMQFGLTDYYDMLNEHAFGNYRDLLEAVTLHPVMGVYLDMLRNEKADPQKGNRADENYAREILQLFSIGVYLLNDDGSLQLDNNGDPIPSYDQATIRAFARVFTGWNFAGLSRWRENPRYADTTASMEAWEDYHDTDEKILLNGQVVPAGGSAYSDLQAALDNIFAHQNVAPFISQRLIQRLVTSNPSPAYVQRVAAVFNDNGTGVKGDLKAVVKAILLDPEARRGHRNIPYFGKLREPLLRYTHFWRAFNAQPIARSGNFYRQGEACEGETIPQSYDYYRVYWRLYRFDQFLGQGPLQAPTAFNFYLPDFSPSGPVKDQNLVAPEFQIATENHIVNAIDGLNYQIQTSRADKVSLDLSLEVSLVEQSHEALLDHLNLLLLNGAMSDNLRQAILDHLANSDFRGSDADLYRARDALMLIAASPDYLIQR